MINANVKCPNCGKLIDIDATKEANICPECGEPFVTEKALTLYKNEQGESLSTIKKRHVWKSLGKGLLLTLKCIGYLFYVIFFIWLFVDITDNLKKK